LQRNTTKDKAKALGMSERQLYKVNLIERTRPDLIEKVIEGELSVHAAYLEARGVSKPTSWDRLVTAWSNATDEDRKRLLRESTGLEWEDSTAICRTEDKPPEPESAE